MTSIFKGLKIILILVLVNTSAYFNCGNALIFNIFPDSDIIGARHTVIVKKQDTLQGIARRFDVAITELILANPHVNPKNITINTKLVIPTEFILPSGPREGIVLNLAEFRIYHFSDDQHIVNTFPVGIGRMGWQTPIGETKIIRKREKPTWVPPDSIRDYYSDKGTILPDSIPPGADNPLGDYAMNLAWPNYLIHGTNVPSSVGLRSSSGCIRMYPEDIKQLFKLTAINTKVRVIHEPLKIGKKGNQLYLEVHESFKEKYYNDENCTEQELLEKIIGEYYARFKNRIDWSNAHKSIQKATGYPVDISR